jgi:hypothetical protein
MALKFVLLVFGKTALLKYDCPTFCVAFYFVEAFVCVFFWYQVEGSHTKVYDHIILSVKDQEKILKAFG